MGSKTRFQYPTATRLLSRRPSRIEILYEKEMERERGRGGRETGRERTGGSIYELERSWSWVVWISSVKWPLQHRALWSVDSAGAAPLYADVSTAGHSQQVVLPAWAYLGAQGPFRQRAPVKTACVL